MGLRPSDLAGITCPFCAYCFDEALYARLWMQQAKDREAQEAEDHISRLHDNMTKGRPR